MHTLQEFLHHTKGMGYVLALVILVAMIPFWLFLTDRERR